LISDDKISLAIGSYKNIAKLEEAAGCENISSIGFIL
jgi:hypothetical protein